MYRHGTTRSLGGHCEGEQPIRQRRMTMKDKVRRLITDMAVALRDFEQAAWDGDPHRRSEDELCMRACHLIDQASEIVEAYRRKTDERETDIIQRRDGPRHHRRP